MDFLLQNVTKHAMNYAIRSGITITSGYALSQCSRLMKTRDGKEREELSRLQRRLDSKIRIISPAIDMIELITARGNTSLESCLALTKNLRLDIQNLGSRLASAVSDEEESRRKSSNAKSKQQRDLELKLIISDMKALLERIEDAVPLINLAITTSGVSLSTSLPSSVSPSRLLQASTFLSAGDAHYLADASGMAQIGPTFILSLYMLFSGHAHGFQDEDGLRHATWQEVIHKTRTRLIRTPLSMLGRFSTDVSHGIGSANKPADLRAAASGDEFAYQISLVEDMDDGRHHGDVEGQPFDGVAEAGIRELVPIHQISKIFYADTGKILNIGSSGETNNPILLLKRDLDAVPPRRMVERDWPEEEDVDDEDDDDPGNDESGGSESEATDVGRTAVSVNGMSESWHLPPGLDPEWLAFEVFTEEPDSDSEGEFESEALGRPSPEAMRESPATPSIVARLAGLRLSASPASNQASSKGNRNDEGTSGFADEASSSLLSLPRAPSNVRTSLSLLEMLIRLTSLQQFQQASHLTINDELLNFFLEESSTTGAPAGDTEERKRIRMEARQRVGFDPYDESPMKRHGEDYQRQEFNWDDERQGGTWTDGASSTSREATPSRSPNLARNQQSPFHAGTTDRTRSKVSSSPVPRTPVGRPKQSSLATPPGSTKSRKAFLRDEAARDNGSKSSPLANSVEDSD